MRIRGSSIILAGGAAAGVLLTLCLAVGVTLVVTTIVNFDQADITALRSGQSAIDIARARIDAYFNRLNATINGLKNEFDARVRAKSDFDFTNVSALHATMGPWAYTTWSPRIVAPLEVNTYEFDIVFPDRSFLSYYTYYDVTYGPNEYLFSESDVTAHPSGPMIGYRIDENNTGAILYNYYNFSNNVLSGNSAKLFYAQNESLQSLSSFNPSLKAIRRPPLRTYTEVFNWVSYDGRVYYFYGMFLMFPWQHPSGMYPPVDVLIASYELADNWISFFKETATTGSHAMLIDSDRRLLASTIEGTDPRVACSQSGGTSVNQSTSFACTTIPVSEHQNSLIRGLYAAVRQPSWDGLNQRVGPPAQILTKINGLEYYVVGDVLVHEGNLKVLAVWGKMTSTMARTAIIGTVIVVFVLLIMATWATIFVLVAQYRYLIAPTTRISRNMKPLVRFEFPTEKALRQLSEDQTKAAIQVEEMSDLSDSFLSMTTAVASFIRYVPRSVVRDLMTSDQGVASVGMNRAEATVLFCDIVSFTTLCESIPVEDLSEVLNTYFSFASRCLLQHNGTIDKFIGDAIMCLWGVPCAVDTPNADALLAAVQLACETPGLFDTHPEYKESIHLALRVGVHCGFVLAGNIGCEERLSYTVLGDVVNTAARLEGLGKKYRTSILTTPDVIERAQTEDPHAQNVFCTRVVGRVRVVGKSEPTTVCEVVGLSDPGSMLLSFDGAGSATFGAGFFDSSAGSGRTQTMSASHRSGGGGFAADESANSRHNPVAAAEADTSFSSQATSAVNAHNLIGMKASSNKPRHKKDKTSRFIERVTRILHQHSAATHSSSTSIVLSEGDGFMAHSASAAFHKKAFHASPTSKPPPETADDTVKEFHHDDVDDQGGSAAAAAGTYSDVDHNMAASHLQHHASSSIDVYFQPRWFVTPEEQFLAIRFSKAMDALLNEGELHARIEVSSQGGGGGQQSEHAFIAAIDAAIRRFHSCLAAGHGGDSSPSQTALSPRFSGGAIPAFSSSSQLVRRIRADAERLMKQLELAKTTGSFDVVWNATEK